ncbi:MAG: hypothetical protein ACYCSF_04995 [Acidimicrobiales bacterium]
MAPARRAPEPPPPGPTAHREPRRDAPRHGRGLLVTVVTVGLGIGILAALPANRSSARPQSAPRTTAHLAHRPRTGSTSHSAAGPPTTTSVVPAVRVALLAPAGARGAATLHQKLASAGYLLVPQAAIPASWVSSLTAPLVRYPLGLSSAAAKVARTLGLSGSTVSQEPAGTSVGSQVIEVFVPA